MNDDVSFRIQLQRLTTNGCLLFIPDIKLSKNDILTILFTYKKDEKTATKIIDSFVVTMDTSSTYIELMDVDNWKHRSSIQSTMRYNEEEICAEIKNLDNSGKCSLYQKI